MRIIDWSSDLCSSDLLPIPTVARQTPNHVHNQENHRNRCAGHERDVAPRMRRLGVVAVLELVHHCGGSFATTPSGGTVCNSSEEHTSERQSLLHRLYTVFCVQQIEFPLNHTQHNKQLYNK